MSAAKLLSACGRIDAAAAAVRVFMVACQDGAEETDSDNVATRQFALRGLAEVITDGLQVFTRTPGGDPFDAIPLHIFAELVQTAEQALWVALGENGKGAPSNADLSALLGLALQFHADSKAARPALPRAASLPAGASVKGTKGGEA